MERADKRAQWLRVAARIREEIMSGRLGLGDRIGGEIELAERYSVSRGVVQRALALLRDEGILATVHGQGSYVAAKPVITTVRIGPADRLTVRLPEDAERVDMRMAPGVPLIIITREDGCTEFYDAAVTLISGRE